MRSACGGEVTTHLPFPGAGRMTLGDYAPSADIRPLRPDRGLAFGPWSAATGEQWQVQTLQAKIAAFPNAAAAR